jgi:hypothetical protein
MSHLGDYERIRARLLSEIRGLGFREEDPPVIPECRYALRSESRDPYSGGLTEILEWRHPAGHSLGSIKIHADGSFFAEYDVAQPHPLDERWFVEGVIAWGKDAVLKSEPKLLSMLRD